MPETRVPCPRSRGHALGRAFAGMPATRGGMAPLVARRKTGCCGPLRLGTIVPSVKSAGD